MKYKFFLPALVLILLAACGAAGQTPTAIPTIELGNNVTTPAASSGASGGVTASGVVVADQQVRLAFGLPGKVKLVNVKAGDQVQAGQLLVQLDDASQQIQLEQANLALQELTSPSVLAAAQETLAQDQRDLYNQQIALNNVLTQHNNQTLIDNAHAGLVLAQNALKDAQTAYDNTPGDPTVDSPKAAAYQKLYSVQKDYDYALYLYNIYSGKANQPQVDEATAKVALAKAKLAEDQTLVAALTGAALPANPTGSGYAGLMQAKFNLQTAQANLDATHLAAPFAGEVASVATSVGDYVSPGQVLVVVSDVQHMHVETTDLSERDIPNVKVGQTATVTIKALHQNVSGKVSVISPVADTLGGDVVYKVTVILDGLPGGVLAGMSVDVQFNTGQ